MFIKIYYDPYSPPSMQQKWGETFTSNYGINCGKITHFKFPPALLFCPAHL